MIGTSLVNLADFYIYQNKKKKKIASLFQESIPYLEEAESHTITSAYQGLGRLYLRQGQLTFAQTWFQKALSTALHFEDLKGMKFALEKLAEVYEKQGNTNEALEYLRRYQIVKDSLNKLESIEIINKLNIEYESEKKEKENLFLQNNLTKAELVNAKQKAQRNQILGMGSLIIFLGLVGFIYYRYRQRIRMDAAS